jgi:BCD family chlorophyll transporter-like MFS transporter
MLLVGMVASSLTFGALLRSFDYIKLIKIVQGAALCTMVLNIVALWKQEARSSAPAIDDDSPSFAETFKGFLSGGSASRLLVAVGLGCAGFNMQDILLEPYGGELLHLSVSATTGLTALMAAGTLAGLFFAARWLSVGRDAYKLAAFGALVGIGGFTAVAFAAPCESIRLFWTGVVAIGFGGGWFSVGTLTSSMALSERGHSGVAIGAWGSVQATVAGAGIAFGGATRDVLSSLAVKGSLGPGLKSPAVGYCFVYVLEIALLFGTLVVIGPLVSSDKKRPMIPSRFGLAELPS